MAQPTWAPANNSEAAMADALRRGDSQAYFQALETATLYLPAFDEPGPQQLVTVKSGEDTYLIVFTSPEALARRLTGVDSFRTTSYPELRAKWPDPAWLLAVDPDTPIQGFMPIAIISEGAAGRVVLPAVPDDVVPGDGFPGADSPAGGPPGAGGEPGDAPGPLDLDRVRPVNQVERDMIDALRSADVDAVIRTLVLGDVHVPTQRRVRGSVEPGPDFPWREEDLRIRTVPVFTSASRLVDAVAPGAPSVAIPFLDLVLSWPGSAWRLVVNPGTALELTFPGEHVPGFVAWAEELVHGPVGATGPADTTGAHSLPAPPDSPPAQPTPSTRTPSQPTSSAPAPALSTPAESVPSESVPSVSTPVGRSASVPSPAAPAYRGPASSPAGSGAPAEVPRAFETPRPAAESETHPGETARVGVGRPAVTAARPAPEEPPPAVELLQKIVPHRQVDSYLHGHWSQVSGPVHRYAELHDPRTPAELYAATGGGHGVFQADDPWVHVIRWMADCAGLYRPFRDPAAPGGAAPTVLSAHAVTLPHGAQLHRLDRDAGPTWLASFDADIQQWVPAPEPGGLRQALTR